jgi:chemotaxis protein MotA
LGEFLGAVKVMGKVFSRKIDDPVELITQIVELANIARKDGMIALEGQEISNSFLSKAVAMLVDGTDGEIIKSSLNRDNMMMKRRHSMGANIFGGACYNVGKHV